MTPFTLSEDESAKIVQLSGDYYTEFGCSINELKAVFYATGYVELIRFKNHDDAVTRFNLTSEEADALSQAQETFKAQRALKKLAEDKRVAGVVEQVRELLADTSVVLEEHPATESNTLYWTISLNELDLTRHAVNVDILLKHTNDVKAAYEQHQASKVSLDEAFTLAEKCPAITINGDKGATAWCVVMQNPGFLRWTHSGRELLKAVQTAKAKHDQWQVEQARALVKGLPITIEEYPDPVGCCLCWAISSAEACFSISPPKLPCIAYDTEQLMRYTEEAKAKYEQWQQDNLIRSND